MKKLIQAKFLTMICFLIVLFVVFFQNISDVIYGCRATAWNLLHNKELDLSIIQEYHDKGFTETNRLITLNGGFQRLMGARGVNERYKLDNGHLTYVVEQHDVYTLAQNTVAFHNALAETGIPLVYVNTPFKLQQNNEQLPTGIQDFSNKNADNYLMYLQKNNVPFLDLRNNMESDRLDHYSMFYKNDHHWTAEAGLWAAKKITSYLSRMDSIFSVPETLYDSSNYTFQMHKNTFLGSAGRRVGPLYNGLDDMTLIIPNFETNISFVSKNSNISRQGRFDEAFLFMENLETATLIESNGYNVYCNGDHDQVIIHNYSSASGNSPVSKKVLLLKDSFSNVLIPYLSLGYEELDVIDLRYFTGNLLEHVQNTHPDLVLVIYNPGAYENHNAEMFQFISN